MDTVTKQKRSEIMSKILSKNSKIEIAVRKKLFSLGFRYRIHAKLPGKPDLVLPKYKLVVFINGCFWHGHVCKIAHLPKSNIGYWKNKIASNKKRDAALTRHLAKNGWKVITIWECKINTGIDNITKYLRKDR